MVNTEKQGDVKHVSISRIILPEATVSPRDLRRMMISITQEGVTAPIVVEKQGDAFLVKDGLKRVLACKELDIKTVPYVISIPETNRESETKSPTPKSVRTPNPAKGPNVEDAADLPDTTSKTPPEKSNEANASKHNKKYATPDLDLPDEPERPPMMPPVNQKFTHEPVSQQSSGMAQMPQAVENALSSIAALQRIPLQMEKLISLLERQRENTPPQRSTPALYAIFFIAATVIIVGGFSILFSHSRKVKDLKDGNVALLAKLDTAQTKLDSMQRASSEDRSKLELALAGKIEAAKSEIAVLKNNLDANDKRAKEREMRQYDSMRELSDKIVAAKKSMDSGAIDPKLVSDISRINRKLTDIEEFPKTARKIEEIQNQMSLLFLSAKTKGTDSSILDALQKQNKQLQDRIAEWTSTASSRERKIEELQAEISALTKKLQNKKSTPDNPPLLPPGEKGSAKPLPLQHKPSEKSSALEHSAQDIPRRAAIQRNLPLGQPGPVGF